MWDLEGGTGAEVAGPTSRAEFEDVFVKDVWDGKGTVVFDEMRIISGGQPGLGGVQVRRFDV